MNVRLTFATICVIIAIAFIPRLPAQAQMTTTGSIDLSTSVDNPTPGEDVLITARSYSTNINAATVTWTVNGKVAAHGVGLTTLTVKAPAVGKVTTVDVTLDTQEGFTFESSIGVMSGSVDFVIEPDGYVPPFFSGKIPVTYQNMVKVVAVPHLANSAGVEYDPKTLIYKWEQGTTVLETQSGYGRQSVTLPGSIIPRPLQISVTVSTRDGSNSTSHAAMIAYSGPFISFYKNDPLYGPMYNKSVGQSLYFGSSRETAVVAVPFGFNMPTDGVGNLNLKWLINGTEHTELAQNRTITLRAPAGTAGTSDISLTISNAKGILQNAEGRFSALFTAGTGTSSQIVF